MSPDSVVKYLFVFRSLKSDLKSRINNTGIQDYLPSYLVYGTEKWYRYDYSREIGISETNLLIEGLVGETPVPSIGPFLIPIIFYETYQKLGNTTSLSQPVLRIRDIFVQFRIRRAVPLTNGSGSCYFRQFLVFLLITFGSYTYSSKIKSHKHVIKQY